MRDMLDISILSAEKYLISDKRKQDFIFNNVTIYEKIDGIKVSIIKVDNTGDYKKDFIVSYKTNIIYPDEFEHVVKSKVKSESINNSQFVIIFDMLSKCDYRAIPLNYEFFVEFLIKKPTLQHKYDKKGVVLLAYSPTTYEVKFGRLYTKSSEFIIKEREKYAKLFGFDYPKVIFKGCLANFENGIQNNKLKTLFLSYKNILNIQNIDDYISKISNMFLELESEFGGAPEGFVLDFGTFNLKIQQPYQTDKAHRMETKNQYMGTIDEEVMYWNNVRLVALNILGVGIPHGELNSLLKKYTKEIKAYNLNFSHPKKTPFQIKDDIQLTLKNILIKRLKGNNNFLFLGKFRIFTNAHYNIIKNGLKKYDNGTICLVSSKETKDTIELRKKMVKECFPNINIIEHSSGNLMSIINKAKMNINAILCGTDRVDSYKRQLKMMPDVKVDEIKRADGDMSATEVISKLNDEAFFKKSTPREIHKFYDEIKKTYDS